MSTKPSPCTSIRVADVSELAEAVQPWDLEMAQLTGGTFEADLSLANIEGLLLSRERWSQKVLAAGTIPEQCFMVAIMAPRKSALWRGADTLEDDLIWGIGGSETEFLIREGGLHYAVLIPLKIFEQAMGPEPCRAIEKSAGVVRIAEGRANWLRWLITSAMTAGKRGRDDETMDGLAVELCTTVSGILGGGDAIIGRLSARKSRQTCFRAVRFAENAALVPSVLELAEQAGVSMRVLELAFRETLGLSPLQFLTRLRLNRLHAMLRIKSSDNASVTTLMHDLGFTELGRTAQRYRELFEEKPSETLSIPYTPPKSTFGDVMRPGPMQ